MLKSENQAKIFSMGTEKLTKSLKQAGYDTIFDIASESFSEFKEKNPEIKPSDAKDIYKMAIQRKENLHMLFNSFKLRNDPVVKNIKKLSSVGKEKETYGLLKNSLDGGDDFEDLFPERSENGYAELTSIQSLFSPGRYLTLLYKVARNLHDENSYLHIDKRRPDLQNIVLSNDNMNKEVSSLDILLDILEGNESNEDKMNSLKDKYYPMATLPYDDDLTQIREVLKSNSLDLTKVQDILLDTQKKYFTNRLKGNYLILSPTADTWTGRYVGNGSLFNRYNLFVYYDQIDNSIVYIKFDLSSFSTPIYKVLIFLTCTYGSGKFGTNRAVTVDSNDWNESSLNWSNKPSIGEDIATWNRPEVGESVVIDVTNEVNNAISKGEKKISIAITNGLGERYSTWDASKEYENEEFRPIMLINKGNFLFSNEVLSLTPNSYNLITNSNLTDEDIANHYNVKYGDDINTQLVNSLNNVDMFCEKTGLSFNELFDLTMQNNYDDNKSRFIKFGESNYSIASEYGAVYLTGQSNEPLKVKNVGIMIAPTDDTYVRNGEYDNNNYGSEDGLVVKNDENSGFKRETYIKFDLSSFSESIKRASISLRCMHSGRSDITHQAMIINDDDWNESQITWNNKPSSGKVIANWKVPKEGEFIEIDITGEVNDAISNNKEQISICIVADKDYGSSGDVIYASKEYLNKKCTPFMKIEFISIKVKTASKIETAYSLNFNENNVVDIAGRAEKLVRLSNNTGLTFEQLDWLITNLYSKDGEIVDIDEGVLEGIASFKLLNKRYGITSDEFVTFVGEVNTYAEKDKKSFYEATFTSADGKTTIPLGSTLQFEIDKQGLYESICCRAMKVTPDEFYRIGKYCFGESTEQIIVDESSLAKLYRMGKIPNMLGMTFSEVELLWKVISNGEDTIIHNISNNYSLMSLDIILRTEAILHWMSIHNLDILSLQAMITNIYSTTATAELYNFLSRVYKSIKDVNTDEENLMDIPELSRSLATQFNLKPNVMTFIIKWLEICKDFSQNSFIDEVKSYFESNTENELTELEKHEDLVRWCQQISQFVIVVNFFALTEQDLKLIVEQPNQFMSNQDIAPELSLYLLLLLSRFKEWQQRLKVSIDEAMRYFDKVNLDDITYDDAIDSIKLMYGWNEGEISAIISYLFGDNQYPMNFEDMFNLESSVNLIKQLKIGSQTLKELYSLIGLNEISGIDSLINSIACSMMATIE